MLQTLRLLIAIVSLGCLVHGAPESSKPAQTSQPAPKTSAGRSDLGIQEELKARLAKSKLAADKFTFKVQNGTVTWEGKTDVIQHKGTATRMAKAAGAKAVVNNIQVSEAARKKAADTLEKARSKGTPKRAQVTRG